MSPRLRNATSDTFRSLSSHNFRLFFAGQFVSQVGNWLTMIAMTLLVLDRTDSGLAVGIMAACQFLPVLLFGPWAGLVADRSDKRKLLLVVQSVAMAQSFLLAALAFGDDVALPWFYLVALIGGFAVAFDNPARRSFVVELVDEEDVPNAVSLNSAMMTGSRILGPALAGLLIELFGFGWAFLADGLSYLTVLWGLWLIDTSTTRRPPLATRGKGQVREGLRYVRQVPVLWISLVMMALVGTLTFNFSVVFPLFVTESLGGTNAAFTILFSVTSIGSLVGALSTARRRQVELRDVIVTTALFGGSMALLALAPNLAVAYPVSLLVGFTSIAFMTTATSIVQLRADPSMRGRVLALQAMVFLGSTPIGGPILGAICDAWGARSGLLVGAAAALGASAWGWSQAKRHVTPDPIATDEVLETGAELGMAG
jgi:MFS family permease